MTKKVASSANLENLPRKTARDRNSGGGKNNKIRVGKTATPESVLYPSEGPRRQERCCLFVLFSGCTFPAEPPRCPPAPLAAQPAHRARARRGSSEPPVRSQPRSLLRYATWPLRNPPRSQKKAPVLTRAETRVKLRPSRTHRDWQQASLTQPNTQQR